MRLDWLGRIKNWATWAGLALLALLLLGYSISVNGGRGATFLWRLDALIYDWRFGRLPPTRPTQVPIVIVDIDEPSLQREGRWPWSRVKVARLIDALEQQGAKLIGFDVVFSEPEDNPIDQVLADPEVRRTHQRLQAWHERFDADGQLATAVERGSTVLGYVFHSNGVQVGQLPFPFQELTPAVATRLYVRDMPDYSASLPRLADKAWYAGFFTTLPDPDGVIRRSPLVLLHQNALYTALSLELAKNWLQAPFIKPLLRTDAAGRQVMEGLQLGGHYVPTDKAGQAIVPYKGGRGSYPYLSATEVLHRTTPDPRLKDAIVLVGTSTLGLFDLRTTPLETNYPGVEVHANLVDAILQSTGQTAIFPYRPDWEPGATFLLLVLSGLLLALWLPRLAPAWMLVVSVLWTAGLVALNFWLWQAFHLDLPLAMALITALALAVLNVSWGFLRENRQRQEVKAMFGQYVPPAHVEQMLGQPERVSLEGESREMTVLFSDIRGFTTLSEGLSAADLKQLLNRFFTPITRLIFDHQGTIDKYVGDMVMAFWGAPLSDSQHASHAVSAALAMLTRVDELRTEFRAAGLPEINIGIGINTGVMNVGDMGSSYRRAYTVIGDAVNLGSRLEGVTKYYGVRALVGQATREQAPEFLYRTVDRIVVKGKTEPVLVSEPLCRQDAATPELMAQVVRFEHALAHYYAQRWDEAASLFDELIAETPDDELVRLYLERIETLAATGVPDDWGGVFEHSSK